MAGLFQHKKFQKVLYSPKLLLYNKIRSMQSDEERTMVMEKNKVKLTICGAEYIIGSDEDSKYMIELGDEVDEKNIHDSQAESSHFGNSGCRARGT